MNPIKRPLGHVDRWQQRNRVAGAAYGVVKKFGDDNANLLVVSLAWYGFTAIFPLLLVVVTVLGFVGEKSLGSTLVSTLHQFPVIGDSFNPGSASRFHGSTLGLVVGLVGLLYGAQGVTQNAQLAMASVWDVPATRAHRLPAPAGPQLQRADHDRRRIPGQRRARHLRDPRRRELRDPGARPRRPAGAERGAVLGDVHRADPEADQTGAVAARARSSAASPSPCSSRSAPAC